MLPALVSVLNDRSHPLSGSARTGLAANPGDDAADDAIAASMASGNIAALDELYRRHKQAAFAAAFALLRDPCAAEDVVHDAFLRAWRSAASFRPERGALRSWLLTIVRHTAIDQLRARQLAMRSQPKLICGALNGDGDADMFIDVALAADAQRLRDALSTLPTAQRHALELAFFAGLTHGEIAARTGTPLGTVKGRVRLGLRRLRLDLADLAPEPDAFASRDLHAQAA